jgi:hypothetical protein
MHADLTRWTFDPDQGYRSVVLQQGRVLLDAEWNEQASIDAHHDEARTADIVGAEGGPAPLDGGVGPFGIIDATTGAAPSDATWANLAVSAGRYYVDGVLVESRNQTDAAAPVSFAALLADQPFLEPAEPANGRYAVYLDVFDRLVTSDERPALLESALGGPDTAFRTQTVWQVKLASVSSGQVCSQVTAVGERTPPTMRARLQAANAAADPCSITSGGGYTRLENQLYRVEIFDVQASGTRFVWSRENGSVVAGLDELEASPIADAQLTIDRTGRDDELSIGQDAWIEVTSAGRQVRGEPGWIAQVKQVIDTELHVDWSAGGPAALADIGETPIVRRWESAPRAVLANGNYVTLENGIEVAFAPASGTPAPGDFWLIPARTSRLAYGVAATHGTIEWPGTPANPTAMPPVGPVHHIASLAVLDRTDAGWTLVGDCRHLFPPLTDLITIDLVGGDGQEAMPGEELDEPVRVAVRNGGLPVADARVEFIASDGGQLIATAPPVGPASTVIAQTDGDGVVEVRWTLAPAGPPTQTVTAHRLDDQDSPIDVDVIVTGRLSVASEVAWTPPCTGFAEQDTVQKALDQLVQTPSLRLLGGDGQEVTSAGQTVPQLVRVSVDSPCGPLEGAKVIATASKGALVVPAGDGTQVPITLGGVPGADQEVAAPADAAGVVAFAWQPLFGAESRGSDVLTITLPDTDEAPIQVTAQLDPPGSRTGGIHVTAIKFFTGTELLNDEVYGFDELGGQFPGIAVQLDLPVDQASVQGKPVVRLLLELPWPVRPEFQPFGGATSVWARRTIEIVGRTNADGPLIIWSPGQATDDFTLEGVLHQVADSMRRIPQHTLFEPPLPLRMRFQIDGWAVSGDRREGLERLHLNGHTDTFVDDKGKTRLNLPSTDEVTGGRFDTWFWFTDETPQRPDGPFVRDRLDLAVFPDAVVNVLRPMIEVPARPRPRPPLPPPGPLVLDDLTGRTLGFVERRATDAGITLAVVEEDAPDVRRNTVLGTELLSDGVLRVRVSGGASGPAPVG